MINLEVKPKNTKKGMSNVELLAVIALTLLFIFIVGAMYKNLFAKTAGAANEQISSLGDFENDGIKNFADKCPCEEGVVENDGCPSGYRITDSNEGKERQDCLKAKT